jgi:Ca-activated chloride channel family protein
VAVLLLVLLPTALHGSPASALREYKAGKYDQALKEYEQLLKRKSDDPRLHFNAGAAAYRNRQFEEAAKQFNSTLSSPDLKLQGLAYYNEGNSLYHLGERNPDPKKRTEAWEKALQDYQNARKLSPQDADAKSNYEFVKRKLEELKQQQQQSKQDKSDQKDKQDQQQQQQQQQNQQQQDQQKNDQQKQQQAQKNQSEQKKDSSQQEQQAQQKKQDEQKQQQQEAAKQSQEQKDQAQQAQQSPEQPKDKGDEKEQEAAAAQAAGQMTQQQARQLLDTQKGDEQMLPVQPSGKPVDRSRPIKDW